MNKIVILDSFTANPGDLSWQGMEDLGILTIYERTSPEDVVSHIGDANVVLTNKVPITEKIIAACPTIKYIGVLATGYNVVDTYAAKGKGIVVTNIPSYSTASVAQFTIALLLEICHPIRHHNDAVHSGRWTSSKDFTFWDYPLIELAGKTFGIIGYGSIGKAVATIAKALGMKVVAHTRSPEKVDDADVELVSLDELFSTSDIISLHSPLTPQTQNLIDKHAIAQMKNNVVIINTSRGPLINEQDLTDALNSGKVSAAAVDVVSAEPIAADNPLLSAKNCIITPHIAWAPKEARERLVSIATNNISQFLSGNPINIVK